MAGKILVVGSFVYDLVVWLPYFPRKGETLLASQYKMFACGKGFNQAISARRCGAEVSMIGKVGIDQFGAAFIELMQGVGIDHIFVFQDSSISTSLGIPMIDPNGDNSIIGIPRANTKLNPVEIRATEDFIIQHEYLLIQNEIPLSASLEAAEIARKAGMIVIYNPAPAVYPMKSILPMDGSCEPLIDWLIPNEIEAEMLSGMPVTEPENAMACAESLMSQGVRRGVVITMGSKGLVAVTIDNQYHLPAYNVIPVDPTGAGDAFCGSFATALADGKSTDQALCFANAAGALAVTRPGAEPSLPKRAEIDAFLYARS